MAKHIEFVCDFLGQEIRVGDFIAFNYNITGSAVVVRLMPTKVEFTRILPTPIIEDGFLEKISIEKVIKINTIFDANPELVL